MKFDAYLFDLDGTLIDSSLDIAEATNFTLRELGFEPKPVDEIIKHVGYGGRKLLEGILGTDEREIIDRAVSIFREYYFSNPSRYTKLYPGVLETLKTIKDTGKKVAVVTNKYEDISKRILEDVGIIEHIDIVVGGDTLSKKKPDPEPVLHVINRFSVTPERALMVGDSETDIISGKSAGAKTCLVMFGYGKKELAKSYLPDYIVESIEHILKLG